MVISIMAVQTDLQDEKAFRCFDILLEVYLGMCVPGLTVNSTAQYKYRVFVLALDFLKSLL